MKTEKANDPYVLSQFIERSLNQYITDYKRKKETTTKNLPPINFEGNTSSQKRQEATFIRSYGNNNQIPKLSYNSP